MKLLVEIELGNDAMRSGSDVFRALQRVQSDVLMGENGPGVGSSLREGHGGTIMDDNGNTVGKWEVVR